MMRLVILPVLLGCLAAVGCGPRRIDATPRAQAQVDGLKVTLELPGRTFKVGENFLALVTAENVWSRPLEIVSRTGTPVYLRIWRHTGVVWEEVKRYPQASTMVMTGWTIRQRAQRQFAMPLTVEPDWPTGELLSMTAEIDGREQASPRVTFDVAPPAD